MSQANGAATKGLRHMFDENMEVCASMELHGVAFDRAQIWPIVLDTTECLFLLDLQGKQIDPHRELEFMLKG